MAKNCYILGISAFYHDSSATLLKNGQIVAGAHEERFSRIKHDESFPVSAIKFCLQQANITSDDLQAIVFYEKPFLKLERIIKSVLKSWPFGFKQFIKIVPIWINKKLFIRSIINQELQKLSKHYYVKKTRLEKIKKFCHLAKFPIDFTNKIFFTEHHLAHGASAVYTSPFKTSAVLVVDGVGELATTSIGIMKDNRLKILQEIHFPNSLGLLYSTITAYLGFKVNSAEYKVMGLAPYGEAKYLSALKKLINIYDDGSYSLNMEYFAFEKDLKMYTPKLEQLLGGKARLPESSLNQKDYDIAKSLQVLTNEIMINLAKQTKKLTNMDNLCLAGGVALNCVSNEEILKTNLFKNIHIQPASGDAGGSLGAILYYWYNQANTNRKYVPMSYFSPYLGPSFSTENIKQFLDYDYRQLNLAYQNLNLKYTTFKNEAECCQKVAKLITGDNVIGWFQGKAEFGPRALGNRSIIADARVASNWQKVNLKIKFRESFRPFAPTVLAEKMPDYFQTEQSSPYMLLTLPIKTNKFPAITHKDQSARVQSVTSEQNPKFYRLIKEFYLLTDAGLIINTSFNVRSEPMVLTPADAFKVFVNTAMDYLVLDNFLVSKNDNLDFIDEKKQEEYLQQFILD